MNKSDRTFSIHTIYDGQMYRSRVEARMAMALNLMNIRFQYEPTLFHFGKVGYVPDFYLPDMGSWLECKGQFPLLIEQYKAKCLALRTGQNVHISCGVPPQYTYNKWHRYKYSFYTFLPNKINKYFEQNLYWFASCNNCGKLGIVINGNSKNIDCDCTKKDNSRLSSVISSAFRTAYMVDFDRLNSRK